MWPLIAFALAAGIFAATFVLSFGRKVAVSRALLWVGLVAPFSFSVQRETQDVAAGATVGALDSLRFGIPLACLLLAVANSRPLRRGHGGAEWWLAAFLTVVVASSL